MYLRNLILLSFAVLLLGSCGEPQPKSVKIESKNLITTSSTSGLTSEDFKKFGIDESSIEKIKAVTIGEMAPNFIANDQSDNSIELSNLTAKGEVVLIFYRGYWCGYCTKYLATYIDRLKEIEAKGATVIAIAPEGKKNIAQTVESTNLEIPFISDSDHKIMDKYGVSFKVNDSYNTKIEKYKGQTLLQINEQEEAYLPIPATYIIGKDGKVKWAHFDPDYSKRATVEEVMANLAQ